MKKIIVLTIILLTIGLTNTFNDDGKEIPNQVVVNREIIKRGKLEACESILRVQKDVIDRYVDKMPLDGMILPEEINHLKELMVTFENSRKDFDEILSKNHVRARTKTSIGLYYKKLVENFYARDGFFGDCEKKFIENYFAEKRGIAVRVIDSKTVVRMGLIVLPR